MHNKQWFKHLLVTIAVTLPWYALASPPANDNFADRIAISGNSGSTTGTNVEATLETGEPSYGDSSVWWKYTPSANGTLVVDTIGSDFDTMLGVYTGSTVDALDTVAQDDDSGGSRTSKVTISVTAGTEYQIAVNSFYSSGTGNIILNWSFAAPPANDNFADRITISGESGSTTGSNFAATLETGEPSWGYSSVWWTYMPSANGTLVLDTTGSSVYTMLGIYTGSDVASLAIVGQDDDGGISIPVMIGTEYQIAVTSYSSSETGSINLNWSIVQPPANDNFADRIAISGTSGSTTGSNAGATLETGEPSWGYSSVWWTYTPSANGTLVLDTIGSDFDRNLGVYTGSSVGSLTTVAQDYSTISIPVVAGSEYQIAVTSSYSYDFGNITLNWSFAAPPANDNFADRIAISGTSGSTTGSNAGATLETGEPSWGYYSVWWKYTPSANGTLILDTIGSNFDRNLGVYTGSSVGSLTTVRQVAYYGDPKAYIPVTAGTEYQIAVTSSCSWGSIELNWSFALPPANDNFADRIAISGASGSTTGNNTGATLETGEPSNGYYSVWWKYTPSVNGTLVVDTIGSNFDRNLGVYTGSSVGSLTTVRWVSNMGSSKAYIPMTAGTEYQIAVTSYYSSETGSITLNWSFAARPANDNFADRIAISGASGSTTGSNAGATLETGEPSNGYYSVWWKYTPSANGTLILDTIGSNFDRNLGVYTGSSVGSLTTVKQVYYMGSSKAYIPVTAGTEYQIAVTSYYNSSWGSITLNWSFVAPPANDNFAERITISGAFGSTTGSNIGATLETGEPSWGYSSVWWKYTPSANGTLVLDNIGSNFDTMVGVYTGSSVGSLSTVRQVYTDSNSKAYIPVTAGTEYQIAVTSYRSSETGNIIVNWSFFQPLANDNFADRIAISGASGSTTGSNAGATLETGEPSYGYSSIWWKYTPSANGTLVLDTIGSDIDTKLGVYTGSSVGSLTTVRQVSYMGSSKAYIPVTAGTEYQIAVTSYYSYQTGYITLNWSFAAPPSNDNFADRIAISGVSGSTPGTTAGATLEAGEPSYGYSSVWWKYTPSSNGALVVDTIGSSVDTKLGVYTGSSVGSLTTVAQDDNGGGGGASKVYIPVTAGTEYQVAITSSSSTSTGSVSLNWQFQTPSRPVNDDFANRITISGASGSTTGTTAGATLEAGEPSYGHSSVWWTYTPAMDGQLDVDTIGSNFDTKLGIYTGSSVGALAIVAQDDNSGGNGTSRISIYASAGTEYQIAVTSSSSIGDVKLNWQLTVQPIVLGDTLALGNLKVTVYPDGRLGIARAMQSGTLQWVNQVYAGDNKGSRFMVDGSAYGIGYYSGSAPVLISHIRRNSSTVVTVWTTVSVQVTQTVTYIDGDTALGLKWDIVNTGGTELTDLRWFHGEDTYLLGSDVGGGFWDAATNTVGVQKTLNNQRLALVLKGETTPFAYESRGYGTVKSSVNNGALQSVVDPTEGIDNGYALEWRSASLAAGATWTVNATERFIATPVVVSISPDKGGITGGTAVTITGTAFRQGATAYFGTDAATSTTFVSDTEVHCVAPSHASRIVDVRVVNPDQYAGQLPGCFTFNAPPIITLGPNRSVKTTSAGGGHFVLINAVQDDGYIQAMTYAWKEGQTLLGTTASLDCTLSVGIHVITCDADDGMFQVTQSVTITVLPNDPPVANAGPDINSGVSVTLDGTASTDDGAWQALSFTWSEGGTTLGSGATLQHTFTEGIHSVTLTVSDGEFQRTDDVVVTVNSNQPPVANAGVDQSILQTTLTGATATLDGSASTDDGAIQALTYTWSEGGTTLGSGVTLQHTFAIGVHTVTLTVNDGQHQSTDDVIITIRAKQNPTVTITLPVSGVVHSLGEEISFTANASDPEDGVLTGASLVWTSSKDGQIGIGATFTKSDLSQNVHVISVVATDSDGMTAIASITVFVGLSPNLTMQSASGPAKSAPGAEIDLMWTVKNNGTADLMGDWTDKVFISTDNQVGGDTLLCTVPRAFALQPTRQYVQQKTATLPNDLPDGTYWLIFTTDAENGITETDETDNTVVFGPMTVSKPDLIPSDFNFTGDVYSGKNIQLSWKVTNVGSGPAAAAWVDAIYLSGDNQPGGDTLLQKFDRIKNLAENDSYTQNRQVTLPEMTTGNHWLVLVTDADDAVLESDETNNALVTGPINVQAANFVASDFTATSLSSPGGEITLSWKVTNNGVVPVIPEWNDQLFLSADNQIGDDTPLAKFKRPGTMLNPGASYTYDAKAILPDIPAGDYFIYIKADTDDTIKETDENDNFSALLPIKVQLSNLAASIGSIFSKASVNATKTVSWTVTNTGTTSIDQEWKDSVYLSTDDQVGGDTLLATVSRSSALQPGASYPNMASVTIPDVPAGQYWIIVKTDSESNISETDEADNTAVSAPFNVVLPNLTVSAIQFPSEVYFGQTVEAKWKDSNTGEGDAFPSWQDGLYLSTDETVGNDTQIEVFTQTKTIIGGSSVDASQKIHIPQIDAGNYYLLIKTDESAQVNESDETDNAVFAGPFSVGPVPYDATVAATPKSLIVGNPTAPVTFTGLATYTATGLPVPNAPVKLHLTVRSIKRSFDVTTDADGNFSYTFQPVANEAGAYSVAATHPALDDAAPEDTFSILGMRVASDDSSAYQATLIPLKPLTFKLQIHNLGDIPLSGLAGALDSPPSNITATVQVPSDLPGEGQVEALVTLTASDTTTETADVNLTFISGEGTSASFPLSLKVWPETAKLVSTPSFLEAGMLGGEQAFVEFVVANNGGVKANNVRVELPVADWLTLTSSASLGALEPAASTKITLCLKPTADLALGPYTGSITVNLDNGDPLQVPFNFKCVSDGKGDLEVTVQDQLTYFADTHPNVAGAKVTVMNPTNNAEIISEAVTDATGIVTFQALPAGRYALRISADKHSPALKTIEVVNGIVNKMTVFIPKAMVTTTFSAEFVEIEDKYDIKIVSTFETHVPAPVVVVTPEFCDFKLNEKGEASQIFTVTNHGLITAKDFKFELPTSGEFTFVPLINGFDIPAMTAYEVPVKIVANNTNMQASAKMKSLTSNVKNSPLIVKRNLGNFASASLRSKSIDLQDDPIPPHCFPSTEYGPDDIDPGPYDIGPGGGGGGGYDWNIFHGFWYPDAFIFHINVIPYGYSYWQCFGTTLVVMHDNGTIEIRFNW